MLKKYRQLFFVIIIILSGAVLRFYNLDWDRKTARLHTDEYWIIEAAARIRFFSALAPGFYDYNSLPMYAAAAAGTLAKVLSGNENWQVSAHDLTLVARYVGAFISTVSLILLYLFARRFMDAGAALTAVILMAFSVLPVGNAHFYIMDNWLVLAVILVLLASLSYHRQPNRFRALVMGVTLGVAVAAKNSIFLVIMAYFPVVAIVTAGRVARVPVKIIALILVAAATFITFFILSPYFFLNLQYATGRTVHIANMIVGRNTFSWTEQFIGTGPEFIFRNLVYGYGPVLPWAGFAGIGLYLISAFRKKKWFHFLLALFPVGYLVLVSAVYVKFIRYLLLFAPFFAMFAAYLVSIIIARSRVAGRIATFTIIIPTVLWTVMFFAIYTKPFTVSNLYDFIRREVPKDKIILVEDWNIYPPKEYPFHIFNFFMEQDDAAVNLLSRMLAESSYIQIATPKFKRTFTRLPNLFPIGARFHELLTSGNLGFELIYEDTSYPRLFNWEINDEGAEETFYIFDHPRVRLYRKTKAYIVPEYELMLTEN